MGTCTLILSYELKAGVTMEDVWTVVPDILALALSDALIVYPNNITSPCEEDNVVFAVGSKGRSYATIYYHKQGLLTMNVEHPCQKDDEMLPLSKPYDLEFIRILDTRIQKCLGEMCVRSKSLYVPVRRPCRLPKNYTELGDERLTETDYTELVYEKTSPYQVIRILQSRVYGRVLTLDDDVMIGESDDIYNQTVLGVNRGNNYDGASVLILGGGDGGLLNLLTSLPKPPRHVLMAEIDEEVMKACARYMRSFCGSVLDTYKTDSYTIMVKDCVEVLKDSVEQEHKFDYVINDLTEFSVTKDKYGFSYDFKTNNILMELSYKCLADGGKYLARGNTLSAKGYTERIEQELRDIGFTFTRYENHVPSFLETYCFYEAVKA
ncbi:spermine synthase-like [Pomacea canaliculata]|uniref:spermine synthase-like n=1 Tax=Pomacea canaliculata TaxID=400727 RepID=UPI000D7347DE|nr:spermine synthase-like [Pomacea canaliculata]